MPIFFFTDPALLTAQTNSQAFGPDPGNNPSTVYHLAGMHLSPAPDLDVVAVEAGLVAVQEIPGQATLVNIVQQLFPATQPMGAIPGIQYIIYRGVQKSSLYGGAANQIVNNNNNVLVTNIIGAAPVGVAPTRDVLLGNLNNASSSNFVDAAPIANLFDPAITGVTLFPVAAGDTIGKFRDPNVAIGNQGNDLLGIEIRPRTELLREGLGRIPVPPFLIHEEEVPRSGINVYRTWQRTRWYDGSIYTWLGRRKTTGRGQANSGMRFDQIGEKS